MYAVVLKAGWARGLVDRKYNDRKAVGRQVAEKTSRWG
jgi:hypothetical protein